MDSAYRGGAEGGSHRKARRKQGVRGRRRTLGGGADLRVDGPLPPSGAFAFMTLVSIRLLARRIAMRNRNSGTQEFHNRFFDR